MIESFFFVEKGTVKKAGIDQLARHKKKVIWIDIKNPTKEDMDFLKDNFNFHKLALEDCIHAIQRSKLDDYEDYYFIAMHSFSYSKKLAVQELDIFLGENYIITVHKGNVKCIDVVKERLGKSPILQRGVDFALYVMLDIMVDGLFPITDKTNDLLDSLENEIFNNPEKDIVNRLFNLRRDILTLRKYTSPQREVLNLLTRGDSKFIQSRTIPYMRDIYDHLYRIAENIDISRDIITSSFESYLSTISNRMNDIMKTLTVITTLLLPMTVITGIYGMNFNFMPELKWQYGYLFAIGLMISVGAAMLFYFRKKGWI